MTAPAMPTASADWVLETVLPRWYLTSVAVRPLDIRMCPCQWGPSGHCAAGNHLKCSRTWAWSGCARPSWETHIVSRDAAALTPVWRCGIPCRWLCPCRCHDQVLALFDPPTRKPGRARAIGGNNPISSTDNALREREDVPVLFALGTGERSDDRVSLAQLHDALREG